MEKYIKYGLAIINILISMGLYVFMYYTFFYSDVINNDSSNQVIQNIIPEETKEVSNKVNVEIKGAVEKPGVYQLFDTNIINDLIEVSGGFKENAYTNNINLSRKLNDQMVVYVYTKYEYSLVDKEKIVYVEKECSCPTFDISSCTNNGSSIINDGPSTYSENSDTNLVNINTASKEELMTLTGIGESKAEAIIKYRETNGVFKNIEDIINVSGISENIYAKIKDNISI